MPAPQEPRSPRPETEYTWQGDWARPTPPPEQPPRPAPTDRSGGKLLAAAGKCAVAAAVPLFWARQQVSWCCPASSR